MFDPKTNASSTSEHLAKSSIHRAVQVRAYQLYERRGKTEGYADQDWYQAEADLRSKNKKLNAEK